MNNLHSFMLSFTSEGKAFTMLVITVVLLLIYLDYVEPLRVMLNGDVYLDLRIGGYDLPEAMEFFALIGEEGRNFYTGSTVFDTVWPLCAAVTGFLFSPLVFRAKWLVLLGAFFPVAFGVLDLFENIGLLSMLSTYPDVSSAQVSYSNVFTIAKQTMIPGATVCVLGMPLLALWQRFARRKQQT